MNRLGYLLTDEETDKVVDICSYMGINPQLFMNHCISVMWEAMQNE